MTTAVAVAVAAAAAIIAAATRAIDHHFDEDSVDSNVHGRWRPRSDTGETKQHGIPWLNVFVVVDISQHGAVAIRGENAIPRKLDLRVSKPGKCPAVQRGTLWAHFNHDVRVVSTSPFILKLEID